MEKPDELLHQVGSFEPSEVKRLLAAFETAGIPFELEEDHSALGTPGRWMHLAVGMYPEGSKLAVFVPESHLAAAQSLVASLFPL